MLKFKSKFLTILVNALLAIWILPQWITGILGWLIFRNGKLYYNEDAKILVLNVNKGHLFGNACCSSGPIIFTTPECNENTIKHETGHSVQSLIFGILFHIIVSIPSVCLFWYKRLTNKDQKFYHSHWPEGGNKLCADELGHVNKSEYGL